jgi:hypothetical protein
VAVSVGAGGVGAAVTVEVGAAEGVTGVGFAAAVAPSGADDCVSPPPVTINVTSTAITPTATPNAAPSASVEEFTVICFVISAFDRMP